MKVTTINTFNKAGRSVVRILKKQLTKVRSGNKMAMKTTGALAESMRLNVSQIGVFTTLEVQGNSYGGYPLNTGRETPFSWSGAGPNPGSPYIRGLVAWLGNKKGLYGRPALQAAFRIARSQEGKTIPKSPGWINEVKDDMDEEVIGLISSETTLALGADIHSKLNITI